MFVCPKSFHIHVQFVFYFSVRSYTWPNRTGLDRSEILVTVIARGSESEFGLTRSRVPGRQGLSPFGGRPRAECPSRHGCCRRDRYGRGIHLGRRFAAALLPRLFGTNPRSHHKGATGRVRTGDQRLPALCHCQLGQDIPNITRLSNRPLAQEVPTGVEHLYFKIIIL